MPASASSRSEPSSGAGGIAGTFLAAGSDLDAVTVAAYRLLVGGGLLILVLGAVGQLRRLPWSRAVVGRVVSTGFLAALYQGCYFGAVSLVSVSTATLIALGGAPVLVAVATAATGHRPPARVVVSLGVALTGLVLLVGAPAPSSGPRSSLGLGLALVAAGAFATMTVLNRRPVPGLHALALTGLSFSWGGLVLLPMAGVIGSGLSAPHGAAGWLLVLYLGLVPTAVAYGAYFGGLAGVAPTTATLIALLEPLTAAVGAAVLLRERLGWAGITGGALLAGAIVLLRPGRGG